ncbi:hypothetical protein RJ640_024753 [Escallonia rubra]|uniref:Xylanase inhibitor N-terminal domain-containing protein n=1 Tax=Escallonia rubra TaxID=112253 RepID=A0AA88UI23_9ASTE|nr:hypothetical protein RJ640_024753 [Escallonia rubra]
MPESGNTMISLQKPFLRQSNKTRKPVCTFSVYLKTPLQPTNLFLDLGASFSWVDCTQNYTSTTYHSIPCNSSLYKLACSNCFDSPGPGCSNDSCALFPENSATQKVLLAQALVDTLALPLTNGRNPGRLGLVREFVLSCSKTPLLKGFPKGTTGLGRSNFSLPALLSSIYSIPYVLALCLYGLPSALAIKYIVVDGGVGGNDGGDEVVGDTGDMKLKDYLWWVSWCWLALKGDGKRLLIEALSLDTFACIARLPIHSWSESSWIGYINLNLNDPYPCKTIH